MYVSLLFWLAMVFPGYVAMRRVQAGDHDDPPAGTRCHTQSGLLGTVAVAYVGTLGLLSPVSILCYLLRLPVAAFSCVCAALVVAAVVEITRRRWWADLGRLVTAAISIELAILAVDLLMGARVGAHLDGDTRVHLARIRFLLDHGFSNYDPFIAGQFFFPIYHTNILHAVYAACGQLTGVDHFGVWFASLVWAKLMVASGIYYLVWCVFDRSWPAWLAAVYTIGLTGPVNFIVYPNKLAPLWLLPVLVGFAVRDLGGRCTWSSCVKLAVGSLVLGQMHGLYSAVEVVVLAPVLGTAAVNKLVRKRPDRWPAALCAVGLLAALPFPLASKLGTPEPIRPAGATQPAARGPIDHPGFLRVGDRWWMVDPHEGFTAGGARVAMLAGGIAVSLIGSRRRYAIVLAAVVGVMALVLYTPPLCTAALAAVGQPWILGRFECILRMGLTALLVPGIAFLLESWIRPTGWKPVPHGWVRGLIAVGVLFLGIASASPTKMHNWTTYRQRAVTGQADVDPEGPAEKLQRLRNYRRVFEEFIPRGETILAPLEAGLSAVMLHDCHIVAGARGNNGVPDFAQRRRDVGQMLADDTPWPQRRALLQKYGAGDHMYLWPSGLSAVPQWATDRSRQWRDDYNLWLLRVTID